MADTFIDTSPTQLTTTPSRGLLYWGWKILRRSLLTIVQFLILLFLISFAGRLALGGGIQSFPNSIPDAFDISVDFLRNLTSGRLEALDEVANLFSKSFLLLIIALSLGTVVGLILGGIAAIKRGSRLSTILMSSSVLVISTPSYVIAMFMIWSIVWIFSKTGVRILPIFGFGWDEHLIIPALVLSARPMASMLRLSYTSLVDIMMSDYIRTAHSKGLHPRWVFTRHVIRNAGVPLLTTAGVSLRYSLAVLPIVEYVFNWNGIGQALLRSIQQGDLYRLIVMVIPLSLLFILANIILDFANELIDPRLRKVAE